MENRKYVKILIPVFILGFFIFQNNIAFAYSINTHAYLTSEVVKFYNQNFSDNEIPAELNDFLIDGSRREDDAPRWMNHFYDPVNNRGLTDSTLGTWQKSEDWAQDGNNQNNLTYKVPATIASILTAIQQRSVSVLTTETDFNWNRAIKFYILGDKEKAMFLLGHVIHLIQDTSVPEHTRNDKHALGNPYENYTGQFSIYNPDGQLSQRLTNKGAINFNNLNSYFDDLAKYSNNNFYSAGTIGIQSGYNLPEPDYDTKIGKYLYPTKIDKEFGDYYLFRKSIPDILTSNQFDATLEPDIVLKNYWSRLSVKSVQYGAGVISLFFQEAEAAKNDPNFDKTEEKSVVAKALEAVGNFAVQVGSTAGGIVSSANNFLTGIFNNNQGFQQVGQVDLTQDNSLGKNNKVELKTVNQQIAAAPNKPQQISQTPKAEQQFVAQNKPVSDEIVVTEEENRQIIKEQDLQLESQIQKTPVVAAAKQCSFNTSQNSSRQKIIINEVAWMGTTASANDEWIELKNISNNSIDINNWQLIDKDEQIKINFALLQQSKIIGPGKFILLERTNDNSVPGVKADLIYSGALSNSNEGLRLFDGQCNLMDEVPASSDWPAGNGSDKKTMERDLTGFGWHASSVVGGTPRVENSIASAPAQTQPQITYSGGGGGISNNQNQQSSSVKVLINEIQISPTGNRFIKLYNPNDSAVNLTNWYIQRKTQAGGSFSSFVSKTHFENKIIQAKGYLLISRSTAADIVLDSLTLTEANTIQIKNSNGDIIDKVGWGSATDCEGACAPEPAENQSMQRKPQNGGFIDTDNNASDFEVKNMKISQSNQAPDAFFVFSPASPEVGQAINFDASSSTDSDGQIISYQWDFGDNQNFSATTSVASHFYSQVGGYSVTLVIFDDDGASSTISKTISVSSQTRISRQANNVVISEIMAGTSNSADEEFIELYNPASQPVSLAEWSLKRRSSLGSTSTINLVRLFPATSTIAAKSYFLIAHNNYVNYSTSTPPDLFYSNNSNPLSYSDDVVILYDGNEEIVDEVYYQKIEKDKSLERKAFYESACAPSQQSGEFLGNACDADYDNGENIGFSDFDAREIPNPQNSLSLPEPRIKPTKPENFIIQYSPGAMELNFNWSGSQDYSGTNLGLVYKIIDVSDSETKLPLIETASTTAKMAINEIGRDYKFSIQAFDWGGLGSNMATSSINVPSFISNLYFYRNPKNADENFIEAYYEKYPFAPDLFGQGDRWKELIFYLNDENGNQSISPVKYDGCIGSVLGRSSLILPDTASRCAMDDGAYGVALSFGKLEDNHFTIKMGEFEQPPNLDSSKFLTVAFYSTFSTQTFDGRVATFQLAATDKTKYYFGAEPARQKPVLSGEIIYTFDKTASKLNLSWPKAIDADTLDNLLTYEIKYNDSENWQLIGGANSISKFVAPGDNLNISVRAKDDFDNYSTSTLLLNWAYPPVDFYLAQETASDWSSFGYSNGVCGFIPGLQSFTVKEANFNSFDMVVLKLKRLGDVGGFSSGVSLSVFSDNNGQPNFGNKMAFSSVSEIWESPENRDFVFGFSSPISVAQGSKYWFAIDGERGGVKDWASNYWQIGASVGSSYADGENAKICANGSGTYYDNTFNPLYADWYMKIGLQK